MKVYKLFFIVIIGLMSSEVLPQILDQDFEEECAVFCDVNLDVKYSNPQKYAVLVEKFHDYMFNFSPSLDKGGDFHFVLDAALEEEWAIFNRFYLSLRSEAAADIFWGNGKAHTAKTFPWIVVQRQGNNIDFEALLQSLQGYVLRGLPVGLNLINCEVPATFFSDPRIKAQLFSVKLVNCTCGNVAIRNLCTAQQGVLCLKIINTLQNGRMNTGNTDSRLAWNFPYLCVCNLTNNKITQFPPSLGNSYEMRWLNISENPGAKRLPQSYENGLRKLEYYAATGPVSNCFKKIRCNELEYQAWLHEQNAAASEKTNEEFCYLAAIYENIAEEEVIVDQPLVEFGPENKPARTWVSVFTLGWY